MGYVILDIFVFDILIAFGRVVFGVIS